MGVPGPWETGDDEYKFGLHSVGRGNIKQEYYILDIDHLPIGLGVVTAVDQIMSKVTLKISNIGGIDSLVNQQFVTQGVGSAGLTHYNEHDDFSIHPHFLAHKKTADMQETSEEFTSKAGDITPVPIGGGGGGAAAAGAGAGAAAAAAAAAAAGGGGGGVIFNVLRPVGERTWQLRPGHRTWTWR